MEERYNRLKELIDNYKQFRKKSDGSSMSEETIRVWLNDLLAVFGWDIHDTSQVIQEKAVKGSQKAKLEKIDSSHTKPDYTLVNGKIVKSYLDAKRAEIDIFKDRDAAFQVRSYGWSAGVPCAFLSNFEQFVIFDCQVIPERDTAAWVGAVQLTMDDYLSKFEVLNKHLDRLAVYNNELERLYAIPGVEGNKTVDQYFNELLSEFRIELAQELYSGNRSMGLSDEELDYFVQIIIDRIIFIRVCETRGLEEKGLLKKFAETDFWRNFQESCYTQFYEHYDGAMFSNTDNRFANLKLDNQVLIKFIDKLYYPYPYRFDAIPVKVIAKVYEEFLSYFLRIRDGRVNAVLKKEYVKTNGAVPTDERIVEAICDETININLIESVDDVWSTHILDPCCGSGIFLIAVYEKLSNRLKELATESGNGLLVFSGEEKYLTVEAKQKLMSSCLYGMDIDPTAVEVTKMSLALKIVDDANQILNTELGLYGEKILRNIDKNIICGNTLVDTDIEIAEDEIMTVKPTDIKRVQFASVFQQTGGFSYIVGNPPYVETKHFKAVSLSMHQYLKKKYNSFQGKADLSVLFVERCIDLLSPEGQLGFIIQRRWFKTSYGKSAKQVIVRNGYLKKLFDIEATDLFPGRITYVSILVLQKKTCTQVEYAYIPGSRFDALNYFNREHVKELIPENYFEREIWTPEFYTISAIKDKYAHLNGTLGSNQRIHIRDGIQALWKKMYHLTNCEESGKYITGVNGFGEQVCIEKSMVKPVIYNKVFLPLKRLSADAYCIFPYKGKSHREKLSIDDIKKDYPKAYEYLSVNEVRIKSEVECNKGKYWHTYTREHNHESFENRKIVIPMTSKDTFAAYESENGFYMDNANVWFITIDNGDDIEYKATTMIINSTIFSVFAKGGANPQSGGYYKFNKQFLTPVPFPNDRLSVNDEIIKELAELYDNMVKLTKQYNDAAMQNKDYFMRILIQKWDDVDELCNKLYGLNGEDWDKIKKVGRRLNRVTGAELE